MSESSSLGKRDPKARIKRAVTRSVDLWKCSKPFVWGVAGAVFGGLLVVSLAVGRLDTTISVLVREGARVGAVYEMLGVREVRGAGGVGRVLVIPPYANGDSRAVGCPVWAANSEGAVCLRIGDRVSDG